MQRIYGHPLYFPIDFDPIYVASLSKSPSLGTYIYERAWSITFLSPKVTLLSQKSLTVNLGFKVIHLLPYAQTLWENPVTQVRTQNSAWKTIRVKSTMRTNIDMLLLCDKLIVQQVFELMISSIKWWESKPALGINDQVPTVNEINYYLNSQIWVKTHTNHSWV